MPLVHSPYSQRDTQFLLWFFMFCFSTLPMDACIGSSVGNNFFLLRQVLPSGSRSFSLFLACWSMNVGLKMINRFMPQKLSLISMGNDVLAMMNPLWWSRRSVKTSSNSYYVGRDFFISMVEVILFAFRSTNELIRGKGQSNVINMEQSHPYKILHLHTT